MNTFIHNLKNAAPPMTQLMQAPSRRFAALSVLSFCLSLMVPPAKSQPAISVTPDSLSAALLTGAAASRQLTISNTGTADLIFSIRDREIENGGKKALQFISNFDYPQDVADVWGYSAPDGTELAIVGTFTGTSFVDVSTDPVQPREVAFIPGPESSWREIKTYDHYAYIITEGGGGLQIVDLLNPKQPVLASTYSASFSSAHNLFISDDGYAYIVGSNVANGGLHILNLADPVNPKVAGNWSDWYVHDLYVSNNIAYAASIFNGSLDFIDVSDKANPRLLASHHYPGAFTHNVWLTDDGKYALTTDETVGGFVNIWNIADLRNIQLVAKYRVNPNHIPHNVYVKGHYAYLSAYVDGVVVLDISDPALPQVVGQYDTYPGGGGIFAGAWGVYPFGRDDLVFGSDIQTGLYVLRFGTNWLTETPTSGVIAPAKSFAVAANFDAHGLAGGDYFADILISSNDPVQPQVEIPVHLKVTSAPDIALSDTLLDYGVVFVGASAPDTLLVTNNGVETLVVSAVSSDQSDFTANPTQFSLNPGTSQAVVVRFTPSTTGDISGTLTITSNDPDEPVLKVALRGQRSLPPDIAVSPDSMSEVLFTGGTATQLLKIENSGVSELNFDINISPATEIQPYALAFHTASDYVEVPHAPSLNTPNFTLEAWINPTGAGPNFGRILSKTTGIGGQPGYELVYNPEDKRVLFAHESGFGWAEVLVSSSTLVDNAWSHVAATYNGSQARIYINGVLESTGFVPVIETNNVALRMGGRYNLNFDGIIDEARIWNIARTPEEIQQSMARMLTGIEPGLVGYWPLNEGSGRTAFDQTSNNNNGSLRGAIIWVVSTAPVSGPLVPWLSADPDSGTVALGSATNIAITFDATGLDDGDYDANIVISNNDPDESKVIVPAHLRVTGAPDIALADTLLNFGTVFLSQADTLQLAVSNNGTKLLIVNSISSDHPAFTPTLTSFNLNPGDSRNVPVIFTPNAVGAFSGRLTIASNDPDEATLTIALKGKGALPPEIAVTPDSLAADLFTGETTTRTLTIFNTGNSDLTFELSIEGLPSFMAPKFVTPAFSLQTNQASALKPARKGAFRGEGQPGNLAYKPSRRENDPYANLSPLISKTAKGQAAPRAQSAIAALTGALFAVDPNTARIVELNPNTGEILNSIPVPGGIGGPDGLAYDGRYLYLKTSSSDTLYQLNPATGEVLASIVIDGLFDIDGLAHSGEALYALGYSLSTIYKIDFKSAVIIDQFTFGFSIGGGITFGGRRGTLFVSDFGTAIYEINPKDWQVINSFSPPNFGSVWGLGYSEGMGLLFASNVLDGMIYALTPNNGTVIFSFSFGGSASALASDEALGVPWLSANPDTGTVAVGASVDIAVVFDATGLNGGDYDARIVIASNDPDERETIVPAHLKVTGAPDIAINVDTIAFGVKFVGYGDTREVAVANKGTDTLKISAIVSDHPAFSATPTSLSLAPRAKAALKIIFLPSAAGAYAATLTIASNDRDEAVVKIILSGSAIEPPIAGIAPDSISAALFSGDSTKRVMTLTNTGGSDLFFKIGAVAIKSPDQQTMRSIVSHRYSARYTFSDLRELWRSQAHTLFSKQETSGDGGASVGAKALQGGNRSHRKPQDWQLLYTDPDEPDLTYDVKNVYGEVTPEEILFRLESYVSWTDPSGQGLAFIYMDADQDTATGLNTELIDDGLGWFLGIDYAILRFDNPSEDGFYRWDELTREFAKIGELTTSLVMPNSNEAIVGIARSQLEESAAINFALFGRSALDPDSDRVPDFGSGHITFLLSPSWLRFSEKEGVIPARSEKQIGVTLDATGLIGGEYEAQTVIFTNDPAHPKLFMPVHLSVTGIPAIGLAADTVDFGTSYAGYKDSTYLRINNAGTDVLNVANVVAGDGRVTVTRQSLAIRPFRSDSLKLYLLATSVGELVTTLSFTTNDPNRTSVTLPVHSTIIIAPNIAVSPDTLRMQVEQGKIATDSLFITNNGGSSLDFSARASHQSKGQALSLDGSGDGVSVPDHAALDLQNSLTLEMWIHPAGIPQNYPRLLAKGSISTSSGSYGAYELALNGVTGQSNAGPAFATIVDANTREPYFVFSGREIEFNTWTHLAATYDGGFLRMYVNGQLEGENFIGAPIAVNNQILVIGKWFSGNFNSFLGEIDEVRVWNLSRTQEEIRQLMFTPLAGNENGLVAYFRFDADFSDASPLKHQATRLGNAALKPSSSPVMLEFLSLAPLFGKVAVNEDFPLTVFADATALGQGVYNATIHVMSNDPDEAERRVPVTVVVSPRVAVAERPHSLPTEFALEQNYPNPFNPETEIRFALPEANQVALKIFNLLGAEVRTLVDKRYEAGYHHVRWDGKDKQGNPVASGVYLYQLRAGSFSQVKKMSLLR